jgi:glutathione S-transferase
MAPSTIKLTYFGIKGRAEAIRQAFYVGGVEFEDARIAFPEWAALKPTTPYGSLPTLEVDGEVYTQSNAMLRYAGKLSGLYPACAIGALKVDGVLDVVEELNNAMGATLYMAAEAKVPAREALIAADGKVTTLLTKLNKNIVKTSKFGFSVGGSLTIADLVITRLVENYMSGILDGVPTTYILQFDNLVSVMSVTHANPAVKAWNMKKNVPKLKLSYFDSPGRAETSRLALAYAGVEFEDERLDKEAFMTLKPTLPYGQMPVLTVGDKVLAQTNAINLYVGKLTGTYPEEADLAVYVDEVAATQEDLTSKVTPSFHMPDGPEKLAARAELVKPCSPFMTLLTNLNTRIGVINGNSKGFILGGSKPCIVDFQIYSFVKSFSSGFLEGIPTTLFDTFENLTGVYKTVGELEAVKAWYAK